MERHYRFIVSALFLFLVLIPSFASPIWAEDTAKKTFWRLWEEGNYPAAREMVLSLAAESPGYLYPAYYLYSLVMENGDLLPMIADEIGFRLDQEGIEAFRADLAQYLPADSPGRRLAEAIVAFNWDGQEKQALDLAQKALAKRKSALGYYLLGVFQKGAAGIKALRSCLELCPEAGFARLLVCFYLAEGNASAKELRAAAKEALSNPQCFFRVEDYRDLVQIILGEHFLNAIGPAGPEGEPYFGPLYALTDWETVKQISPAQKVFLAYALATGGAQDTQDAEAILAPVDEPTKAAYAPLIKILRVYESFHEYDYEEACRLTDELLRARLADGFYFMPLYDLGYQFELFYLQWRRNDRRLLERAVALYEQAVSLRPKWSKAYTAYTYFSLGRSLYYGGRYAESLAVLQNGLAEVDFPHFYLFISLNYYRLGDPEQGKLWETKARAVLTEKKLIELLREYEELLKEAKG